MAHTTEGHAGDTQLCAQGSPLGSDPLGSPPVAKHLQDTAAPSPCLRARFQLQNFLGREFIPGALCQGSNLAPLCQHQAEEIFASRRVHAPKSPRHSSQASLERGPSCPGWGDTHRVHGEGKKGTKLRGWHLPCAHRGDARGLIPPPTAPGCRGWHGGIPHRRRRAGYGSAQAGWEPG